MYAIELVCVINVLSLSHACMQEAVVTVEEGETVYDFQWFPKMSSLDAATCW